MPAYVSSPAPLWRTCSRVFTTSKGLTATAEMEPAAIPAHTHTSERWYWFYYQCCGAGAGLFLLKPEAVKKLRLRDVAVWLGGSVMAKLRVKFKNILHKMKEKMVTWKLFYVTVFFKRVFFNSYQTFLMHPEPEPAAWLEPEPGQDWTGSALHNTANYRFWYRYPYFNSSR